MKKLILMRHAEAQPDNIKVPDRDRTLSGKGLKQLDDICQRLHNKVQGLDLVLCSNARRTRQTLDGIKKILPSTVQIVFEDKLYQGSAQYILERVKRIDDGFKNVLVISHNPGLENFAQQSKHTLPVSGFNTCSLAFFNVHENFWMSTDFSDIELTERITPDV